MTSSLSRPSRWLLLVAIALRASPGSALDPPPADSVGAVRAWVAQTVETLETVAPGIGIDPRLVAGLEPCERLATSEGRDLAATPCSDGLVRVRAELERLRSETPDPLVRAVADRAATQTSGTLSLLAWLGETTSASASDPARATSAASASDRALAPDGRQAALVLVYEDDRSVAIEPLRTLKAGREYALVLEAPARLGEPPAVPASLADESRLSAERFAGATAGPAGEKVAAFAAAHDPGSVPPGGVAPFASVRLTLARPVASAELVSLRAYFVAAKDAPPRGVVSRFRTLDARADLAAARAELRRDGCAPIALRISPSPTRGSEPIRWVGRAETLAATSAESASRTDGDERWRRAGLDLVLALPTDLSDPTPVVIALDGHQGSAAHMLDRDAAELTARGLAVLSFDLVGHGTRTAEGDFVIVDDPARLVSGLRQGAIDLTAAVRAALVCGFVLPDGRTYRPRSVRFLGYSLGSMVGVLGRAVEPDLGTAVLLAPGGDLFGWLMMPRLGPALGARFVACLGGPEHGQSCVEDGVCASPGRCIVDPFFQGLNETLERIYRQATGAGDPLSFATHRTGAASHGRVLLVTGGNDAVLYPGLATRLADAYGMHVTGPHRRRGPGSILVQWPELGHDLHERPEVRRQVDEFLASDGRRVLPAEQGAEPQAPGWYRVFGSSRR